MKNNREIFVIEFKFELSGWTANSHRVFESERAAQDSVEIARRNFTETEYRVRKYTPEVK